MSSDKNYQGTDVNLEISLEEYGFVARPITVDYADEYFVIYKMDDNQYGSGHIRESELDAIVNGTEWASEEDVNSMLETVGATKEEWFDLPFTSKFSDLVSYWGTENIMGTDYYPNDKNWAFEEIGLESDDNDEFAKGGGVKLPKDAKIKINWVDVSVYKDSWEEGETDNVNNYDMVGIKGSVVSPKELIGFLAKNIYTSEDISDYVLIDNNIHTSVRQDADGMEAGKSEVEEWKKGNLELFSANYVINVSVISEIDADSEMLSSLTGINVYKQGGSVKYAKGGGVEANFLQATNLDKKGAESLAETLKEYNNKVRIEKGEDGLYKVYTSSLSGDKYAKGGGVNNMSYENIYEVLKDKIDNSIDDLGRTYENSSDFTGEEIEHKFRDGFIPYTNGGYELSWYEYVSTLNSTGYTLPTEKLQAEMQRHVDYAYELAKDNFKDTYPEIVEVVGEDNIDYNSLYEAGFSDEAEELSNWEMEYLSDEDTIRCSIIAYYYEPTNDKGQDGKHTISLQGDINLEAPYHRKGKSDDFTEVIFTFDSMEELNSKMDDGLKQVIAWFNGDKPTGSDDTFARGGKAKPKAPKIVRTQFEEGEYEYAKGGGVDKIEKITDHNFNNIAGFTKDLVYKKGNILVQRIGGSTMWSVAIDNKPKGRVLNAFTQEQAFKKVEKEKFADGGWVDDALNKNKIFNEFMLEWMIPNKESNTVISKSLKELIKYVSNNNIKNYTIKGWGNNKWETLISLNNSFKNGGGVDDEDNIEKLWIGYASAILFSENDSDTEEPLDSNYSISDFDEETVKSSKDLIRKFYFENKKAIEDSGMDLDTIGNDIWYTRAGHGAGFFDHNLDKDIEDELTKGAKALGELPTVETYDGKISVRGGKIFAKGGGVDDADWIEESLIDLQNEVDMDDLVVENSNNNHYTASNGDAEFEVFETEDDARERAIERVKEDLEENPEYFSKDWLMNYIDGEDFFTEVYNEWNESYANDIESEDSDKYSNRLIEEMVENGIVSSEEAKEDDFDAEDYKKDFVKLMTSNQIEEGNGGLNHYISNFGEEQAFKVVVDNNLIDIDRASESAVDTDGIAHFLSSYDGEQIDLSNGHVAYRTN